MHAARSVDDAGGELRPADVEREHRQVGGLHRAVAADGGCRARRGLHYPFRPCVAMPSTKYRWPRKKMMIIGSTEITSPAMIFW